MPLDAAWPASADALRLEPQRPVLPRRHHAAAQGRADRPDAAAGLASEARKRGLHTGTMAIVAMRSQRSPGYRPSPWRIATSTPSATKFASPRVVAMLSLDIRMPRAEAAEARHQPGRGERRRRADRQHAGIRLRAQPPRRLADLAERVADRNEVVLAGLGQHQRSVAAAEQLRAQPLLEPAHQLADRAGRHRQFGRGLLHAEMACRGLEGTQRVERWQGHDVRIEFLSRARHEESFVRRGGTSQLAPHERNRRTSPKRGEFRRGLDRGSGLLLHRRVRLGLRLLRPCRSISPNCTPRTAGRRR